MPEASSKDDKESKGLSSPGVETDIVGDDDDGFVEVTEDGSPVQDADATSGTDDDESDDDDGDDGTETDKARLANKRKREAQREASKLRRQLAATEARQGALEREMEELRAERLERARGTVQERVTAAEQAYETALEDGDAKGIVAAQRALREAETEAGEWERKSSRPAPRASAPATSNPLVEQFVAKHGEWFDMNGGDTDSVIVRQLSAEIANEGIDPSTKRHFDELDRRMARYLPHRAGASKPKPRATAAAPGGGGGNGSSSRGGSIEIPKATIAGFEQALGYDWNDPTDRAKIIKRVQETRRSRGDQA